ncbi:MAG: hypothetical protein AAF632_02130 [Bacteroidota bacterium]
MKSIRLGDESSSFIAMTTEGEINSHGKPPSEYQLEAFFLFFRMFSKKNRHISYCVFFLIQIGIIFYAEPVWSCNTSGNTAVVGGKDVPVELVEQAKYYTQFLGLNQQIFIRISFRPWLPQGILGYTMYQDDRKNGGAQQAHIIISRRLTPYQQAKTLAHEMVHVEQFFTKKLVKCSRNYYRWESGKCRKISRIPYSNRPWEQDADQRGDKMWAYLQQQLKTGTTITSDGALVNELIDSERVKEIWLPYL